MSFLNSVHESLIWVGLLFIMLGFIASLLLARSITRPLAGPGQGDRSHPAGEAGHTGGGR
ncbi:MAG: hypothetical protein IJU00_07795 [Selenomonas sp.]|nr:hypothetical protein [Selenomonas sp.]